MTTTCIHCGATFTFEMTCRDYFDTTQALEFQDTDFFAVHHLSVPCYLLQHNHYTSQQWFAARQLLHEFMYANLTSETARRQYHIRSNSTRSEGDQTLKEGQILVDHINWTQTIADVRSDTAANYCADVRDWAIAILNDTRATSENTR